MLPFTEKLFGWYAEIWGSLVPVVAKTIFGINYAIQPGSDSTFNAVQLFLFAIIALLLTIIWTPGNEKHKRTKLLYWMRVYIRFGLAFWILGYAMGKILKYQFPAPGPYSYTRTYGETSPMELMWNFMGYSYSYNIFTGIAEATAAILLLFRRTATLGALLAIAVMSNVVMMNFGYDIYVKFISLNLLLMAIYLIVPDVKQLYYFFFAKGSASLQTIEPVFINKSVRYAIVSIEALIIIVMIFTKISGGIKLQRRFGDAAPKSPLAGAYKIETFRINHATLPPLTTDSVRWDILVLQGKGFTELKLMNEKRRFYIFKFDEMKNTLTFRNPDDSLKNMYFNLKRIDDDHILLTGKKNNDSIFVTMRKMEFELEKHKRKIINDDHN